MLPSFGSRKWEDVGRCNGKRTIQGKASSGARKLTLPLSLRGGGVLKKRTQKVSDNVGSEVSSRDLDLRTTYFRCGGIH